MLDRGNRTFICSVVFTDIVEYSKKPVADQMKLKDEFNALISEAIKEVAVDDRIILDTGDGVAINFLGEPEEALFVAMSLRDALASTQNTSDLSARIGINLGPVRVVKDINGQPNIIGDGINVAQRVMSFAQPGEVLVSRSYYEVVSHLSQEYSLLFEYQGARADKHVRDHEVYAVGSPGKDIKLWTAGNKGKVNSDTAAQGTDPDIAAGSTTIRPKTEGRKRILYAGVSLGVVLVLAFALHGGKSESEPSKPQVAAESKSAKPSQSTVAPVPGTQEIRRPITTASEATPEARKTVPAPKSEASKLAEAAPAAAALPTSNTGFITLAINPWGEVYLDGKKMGVSPPLKELQVTPGKHTIEIKNTFFAGHTETLEVNLNDRVKIVHRFR